MWFSGWYVNGGGPISLIAPLQWVRWNASEERTYEDLLALGAIGEDEESLERKWKNKGVWENEKVRGCEEERE